ncbi:MAG: hypothetical protein KatS3mg042_0764 [Rhodothermaceae bacterium]|nr:MAG: hypothetical protein KatS3mg042_0764 [Rhodothermaceae bacterium]
MLPLEPTDLFHLSFTDAAFRVALYVLLALSSLAFLLTLMAVLFRIQNDRKMTMRRQLDRQWQPLLFEVMAGDRDPASLQHLIDRRHEFYFTSFLYRFARRVRGEDLERLRLAARPFLPGVRAGLQDRLPEVRARRLQFLGLLGAPDYTEELIQGLDDPSPMVGLAAMRSLVRRGDPAVLPAILQRLHRFEPFSHAMLASLLARMGFEALPVLRAHLTDTTVPAWVRAVVADALARLDDAHAADLGASLLQPDGDPRLLVALLNLLGAVGQSRHRKPVRPLLDHADEEVRLHAVRTLGVLAGPDDAALLRRALDDPSPWVATEAAQALKRAGHLHTLRSLAASDHPRRRLLQQVLVEDVSAT